MSCRELETAFYYLREVEGDSSVFNEKDDSTRNINIYLLIGMSEQTIDVVEAVNHFHGLGVTLGENSPVSGTKEFRDASRLYPQLIGELLMQNKVLLLP